MAWAPPGGGGGWPPSTTDDMMRVRAMQRQAVQAAQLTASNQPNAYQPNSPQQVTLQQLFNNSWVNNQQQQQQQQQPQQQQPQQPSNQTAALSQHLRLLRHHQQQQQQQLQQQMPPGYGSQNYSMLTNLQNAGVQIPQGSPGSQSAHVGGDGFPGSTTTLNAGHLAGGVPSTNQAVLLALLQQQLQHSAPGQGTGVQVGPPRYPNQIQNNYAGAYAMASQQLANLRSANMRSPDAFSQLHRQSGVDIPGLNQYAPSAQQQIGLLQQQQHLQQQQQLQHQQALMDLQLLSGQHQMYQSTPSTLVDPSNGLQYRQDSPAQQQVQLGYGQRTPITSGLGMGLANTPMGSAPLLPIFGTDLAKPSEMKASAPPFNGSPMVSSAVGSPVAPTDSLESATAQKAPADIPVSQNMTEISTSPTAAAKSPDSTRVAGGAVHSSTDSPAIDTPQATEASHLDSQSTLQESKDATLGNSALGLTFPSVQLSQGGVHKERDVGTLKTIGQMLARTKNTVESAVQTGLLGGCNAEDVQIVYEAFTAEKAVMLEQETSLNMSPQVPVESLGGVKISEEAVKNMLSTGGMPISAPSGQIGGVAPATTADSLVTPIDTHSVNDTLAGEFAACQVNGSAPVGATEQLDKFDAFEYGFFKGDARGELLEELGGLETDETGEDALGGLPHEDSQEEWDIVTMNDSSACTEEDVNKMYAQTGSTQEAPHAVPGVPEISTDTFVNAMSRNGY